MEIDIKFYLGILAGIVSSVSYLIYFYSILKGKSKPNRATWWIWAFMGSVLAASYYYSGARDTMWCPIVEFFGPFLTAILSIKYGEGGTADKVSIVCFIGGIVSIILWILSRSPLIALLTNLAIDGFAITPIIKKSYLRPKGESASAWVGTGIADFINLLAVEKLTFGIIVYPAWMFFNDLIIIFLLKRSKKSKVS